jgi:hypothetical protein
LCASSSRRVARAVIDWEMLVLLCEVVLGRRTENCAP